MSLVNKDPGSGRALDVDFGAAPKEYRLHTLTGKAADSYNDIGKNEIFLWPLNGCPLMAAL